MSSRVRRGITLTEVLVCIVIGVIVLLLFFPAVRTVRIPAARAQCLHNLKQIMLAINNYSGSRSVPRGADAADSSVDRLLPTGCYGPGATAEDRLSWMVALLPQLEADSVSLDNGYEESRPATQKAMKVFECQIADPATVGVGLTHYVAMAGIGRDAAERPAGATGNGFMGYDRLTSWSMIKDGTSNTIGLMETRSGLGPWARGGTSTLRGLDQDDLPLVGDARQFGGHGDSVHAGMLDGSARTINASMDSKIVAAAITIAGGETLGSDW